MAAKWTTMAMTTPMNLFLMARSGYTASPALRPHLLEIGGFTRDPERSHGALGCLLVDIDT